MEIVGGILTCVFFLWALLKLYIRFFRNRNPKYNQFGKTALNKDEKTFISKWVFEIPYNDVSQKLNPEMRNTLDEFDDFELRVEFKQTKGESRVVRSEHEIAMSTKYRYFEVEVIENEGESEIYVGLIDSRESVPAQLSSKKGIQVEDEEENSVQENM